MNPKTGLTFFFIAIFLAACGAVPVTPNQVVAQLPGDNGALLVQAPPDATATATPFQPLPITPTPLATEVPPTPLPTDVPAEAPPPEIPKLATSTPFAKTGNYPSPSLFADWPIPGPMGVFKQPKQQLNILIMGSDQRPDEVAFRTDVILLLTINANKGTATLTSFPRDLYVYLPGWTMDRINTAHFRGGWEMVALTFEYNFGVRPDHWVFVDFAGFKEIVNDLGGIEIYAENEITDWRGDGKGYYSVGPGWERMNGADALWYVRARKTTSDFDRTRRQQEVLVGLFRKLISVDGVIRAPELYDDYKKIILTDMTLDDIVPLLPLATIVYDTDNIRRYAIGPEHVSSWINSYGSAVLIPNQDEVYKTMKQALQAK
ncbi:MAG: hypothetical protein DWQ07_05525 [Chloroflexi bacterium]|nr:MAG: hypothetical protein DWQ07_05525 [Chloroflexota bacterium]MBL1194891.1 hypothetical protein [Chloroflexota bacterium]NOH12182.1 hypothetical protein [Chloroflexota bacterium]